MWAGACGQNGGGRADWFSGLLTTCHHVDGCYLLRWRQEGGACGQFETFQFFQCGARAPVQEQLLHRGLCGQDREDLGGARTLSPRAPGRTPLAPHLARVCTLA